MSAPASAALDPRRKRIRFRCWHRGMREMDLIMGQFADAQIAALDDTQLDDFELLIEVPDRDVLGWLTGEFETPGNYDTAVFRMVRDFHTHMSPIHI